MPHALPTFVQIQTQLYQVVAKTAAKHAVTVVLTGYHTQNRISVAVPTVEALRTILSDIDLPDLQCTDPRTGTTIMGSDIPENTTHIRLWQQLLISGRVIHGTQSGIDLHVTSAQINYTWLTFPDPRFKDLLLNTACDGLRVAVCPSLLDRLQTMSMPRKVDVVFTWVDDSDPTWTTKRAQYTPDTPTSDASDAARFINNDELLFALRGLFRYFHGLGSVYLVTDAQRPTFLDEFGDQIQLIDHTAIMPKASLPTFNSHAIESALHHIPNLRSAYLYSNDDMIMMRPTGVCDFFTLQGQGRMFASTTTTIPEDEIGPNTVAADAAAINARTFFAENYQHVITRKYKHTPVAIIREELNDLAHKYPAVFDHVRQNRFRRQTDLALSGSFYQHYALMTGQAILGEITYHYFNIHDKRLAEKIMRVSYASDQKRPLILCLNATAGGAAGAFNRWVMQRQMHAILPATGTSQQQNTLVDKIRQWSAGMILQIIERLAGALRH